MLEGARRRARLKKRRVVLKECAYERGPLDERSVGRRIALYQREESGVSR